MHRARRRRREAAPLVAEAVPLVAGVVGAAVSQASRTTRGRALLITAAVALGGGWYFTPFSDWAAGLVVQTIPLEEDIQIGLSAVRQSNYRMAASNYGIDAIGQRMVQSNPQLRSSGFNWRFGVIEQPGVINAFAFPGGHIFVTADLIRTLRLSADEIAAVLGHEIGHVVHRHSQRRLVKDQLVGFVLQVLTYDDRDGRQETFGQAAGEIILGLAKHLGQMKFSRTNEYEADDFGWNACVDSGINPRGMVSFFRKLLALEGGSGATSWESTHPGTADRIRVLENKWHAIPSAVRKRLASAA